jgi:uncharacterized DUF497 family protein
MTEIKSLVWDAWNIEHIKNHGVSVKEVEEIVSFKDKRSLKSYQRRLIILGRTKKKRLLTIVLAKEKQTAYYVVTARDMSKKERRYFSNGQ